MPPLLRPFSLRFVDEELEREYSKVRPIRWRAHLSTLLLMALSYLSFPVLVMPTILPAWLPLMQRVSYGAYLPSVIVFAFGPLALPRAWRARVARRAPLLGMIALLLVHLYLQWRIGEEWAAISALSIGFIFVCIHAFIGGSPVMKHTIALAVLVAYTVEVGWLRPVSRPTLYWSGFFLVVPLVAAAYYGQIIERQKRRIFHQRRLTERERGRADVAERARHLAEALLRVRGVSSRGLEPGALFDERWVVVRRLGKGGMGAVYEVEREGRRLALKVLSDAVDREALVRFAREAQIGAQLAHPNLVAIVDVGVSRDGQLFLLMELVPGSSLSAAKPRWGDRAWAMPLLAQIAGALEALHQRGIVHRDLKPGNVLLDGDTAKLADFGISRLRAGDETSRTLTLRDAALAGTPRYMAPELATHEGTAGADIWAFGVLAHELLTGRAPFDEPPLDAALAGRTPSLTIDATVGEVVRDCLCIDPAARPSAGGLVRALVSRRGC